MRCLTAIQEEVRKQQDDALQSMVEANDAVKQKKESLPARSRRALETASEKTRVGTASQYEINSRIARLEAISKSQVLDMQIPILESQPLQTTDVVGDQGSKSVALSETQRLVSMSNNGS